MVIHPDQKPVSQVVKETSGKQPGFMRVMALILAFISVFIIFFKILFF